jgi:2'-5' RNA ligase
MVQSVELLLTPDAEVAVTAQWSVLADAALPSQARHTGATNRPHVTLAVARVLDDDQESAVTAAVAGALPFPLRVGGLLVFGPGPFILCRLVVPSAALVGLQQRIVAAIGPAGADPFGHQAPGAWTPHVTLARRLTADQLALAVQLLSPLPDLPAAAGQVRRWDGEEKVAWTIAGATTGSDRTGSDDDADQVGHHDGDRAQQ